MKGDPKFGSDLIVDMLKTFDIEYAAFNPGATFRGIHDSIVNYGENKSPEVILCCHEEISVAMAHGYAKVKQRPMAAITHNIVGLQHASMAIYNAWCDRVPVIVLGGTGPMDTTRRRAWIDWIHTALVQGTQVRDYVKWDDQPHSIEAVPSSFIRAYRIATTEPMGPVYLCYDACLQEDEIKGKTEIPDVGRFSRPAPVQAEERLLRNVADLLVKSRSPVIVADFLGRNPNTVSSLIELAEALAIPVIDKGNRFNFPNTNPLDVSGDERRFLQDADLILALDVQDLYGSLVKVDRTTRTSEYVIKPSAKIVHISLNDLLIHSWAADYHCLQAVDIPITADTSVVLPELNRLCDNLMNENAEAKSRIASRFKMIKECHDQLRTRWRDEAYRQIGDRSISTAFLASELWEVIKREDWVLVYGALSGWPRKLWDWSRPYQYLGSPAGGGGGLGYGLGASVGAALAYLGTEKVCVDIQPDGDLLQTCTALWTAARHKIPLLIVMHNNRSYFNSEAHAVEMAKFRTRRPVNIGIGTRLEDPHIDFAGVAKGFGVYGEGPIERPEDLQPALRRALEIVKGERLPALVDVITMYDRKGVIGNNRA